MHKKTSPQNGRCLFSLKDTIPFNRLMAICALKCPQYRTANKVIIPIPFASKRQKSSRGWPNSWEKPKLIRQLLATNMKAFSQQKKEVVDKAVHTVWKYKYSLTLKY